MNEKQIQDKATKYATSQAGVNLIAKRAFIEGVQYGIELASDRIKQLNQTTINRRG